MLTILIGMSASGKDAILRELVANHGFREIVTTTTRPMRKGEVNGKDYNFISRKEFEKGITEGRFFGLQRNTSSVEKQKQMLLHTMQSSH